MVFITWEQHLEYLKKLTTENPQRVAIATFNVYAGVLHDGADVTEWGEKYSNDAHQLLDLIKPVKDVRILVGMPPLILCKKGCMECIEKHYKWSMRLDQHAQKWPKFQWKYAEDFHLKCYLFDYGTTIKGVIGGRNLSPSNWVDVTIALDNSRCKVLMALFDKVWKIALDVNDENMKDTISAQLDDAMNKK